MEFQEPSPGPAASTWQQDVSIGGEDINNDPAPVALAVAPQGIATVRDVPTISASSNMVTATSARSERLIGKTNQRRRITLTALGPGATVYGAPVAVVNVDGGMTDTLTGMPLCHGVPVSLSSAGEIWFHTYAAIASVTVGYWAEIDLG